MLEMFCICAVNISYTLAVLDGTHQDSSVILFFSVTNWISLLDY